VVRQSAELMEQGFAGELGIKVVDLSPDRTELKLAIREGLLQPFGIVHGGVHCSLVETAASIAAAAWWGERGSVVGVSNQTDFLRAIKDGSVTAVATPIHRGRLQQLWQVLITDEQDRLVARGQVRLQNLGADRPS
jgi:1,4-dihydroxy-2-naphthoyl-CoA hydrolase